MAQIKPGKFVVLEGIDGSGKATQLKKLADYFAAKNQTIATFDFPQYGKPSSYFVREYLNRRYGNFAEVGPYKASIFFALDRFEAKAAIEAELNKGSMVFSNRYIASNMAHQGSNLSDSKERKKYFDWISNMEFEILGIPKPDLNLILRVSPGVSQKLVDTKPKRDYIEGGVKRDMLESDLRHLENTAKVYEELCETFPQYFVNIDCMKGDKIMSPEEIHLKILSQVKEVLKLS